MEGGLRFHGKSGFAHDWITGWTNLAAKVYWELENVNNGTYEVTLGYRCPKENAGAKIRITAAEAGRVVPNAPPLEAVVRETPMDQIQVHNLFDDGNPYLHLKWSTLKLGQLRLKQGPARLTVQALTKPGPEVMDLKYVSLERLD